MLHSLMTTALCGVLFAVAAWAAPVKREDQILLQGNLAGAQTVIEGGGGTASAEYHFNDRGRGDHIIAAWKLDAEGVPTEYSAHGNDYLKAAVTESFH
ncbi:MAG: hypothetical protein WA803_07535, partial [Steroidobacteraceae bacterium]